MTGYHRYPSKKKKDDKKTEAFYDWATTGIPVKRGEKKKAFYD